MCCREEGGQEATLRRAHHDCPLRTDRVEDSAHVVHAVLHGACLDPVREAHAALVEEDEPREQRQPLAELAIGPIVPVDVEVGDVPLDEDQIRRPGSHDLIGDVDVAIPGEVDGRAHAANVPQPDGFGQAA